MDQKYIDFFLKRKVSVGGLDTIELSHPNFSQVYYLTRNHLKGFVANIDENTQVTFNYCPMRISKSAIKDDLDASVEINLGDVGQYLAKEIQNVEAVNGFEIMPTLIYRVYRSDDLSRPLYEPIVLEVDDVKYTREGSLITAKAPSLNVVGTGEKYDLKRFKMLKGVL